MTIFSKALFFKILRRLSCIWNKGGKDRALVNRVNMAITCKGAWSVMWTFEICTGLSELAKKHTEWTVSLHREIMNVVHLIVVGNINFDYRKFHFDVYCCWQRRIQYVGPKRTTYTDLAAFLTTSQLCTNVKQLVSMTVGARQLTGNRATPGNPVGLWPQL